MQPRSRLSSLLTCVALLFGSVGASSAETVSTLRVQADRPGTLIPKTLWGVFFEDISHSADGGLYAELVRNRSFEDSADTPKSWALGRPAADAAVSVQSTRPRLNPFNRHYLRVDLKAGVTLVNEGYWGMNVLAGETYRCRLAARAEGFKGPLTVRLLAGDGRELAHGTIREFQPRWTYHGLDLVAQASDPKARLELSAEGGGSFCLDMVSLMPARTWKGRGLRPDLAEALAALRPGFLRFPGGCWVEGSDLSRMNHWKDSIGAIDTRSPLENLWGYSSTRGLGYHEYLQLAEDLGAEPLFCINVGMSHEETVPLDRMDQWVQDALDAIEYANGPVDSVWGALRAAAGHPAPFNLKYIEVGNENGGTDYAERWPLFVKALQARHPELHIIANTFWIGAPHPTKPMPVTLDEHYYESAERFIQRATQYDSYDRKGPGIFIGEYAVTQEAGNGNLRAAIGEAAFMTGIERNCDLVHMASYAPLFANVNKRCWNPNLIAFDSSRSLGIPSYYVQQLFSLNRGDRLLPLQVVSPDLPVPVRSGRAALGSQRTEVEYRELLVTAPDGTVLLAPKAEEGLAPFSVVGKAETCLRRGDALALTDTTQSTRLAFGDRQWCDFTLSVKARKLAGEEGFAVYFRLREDQEKSFWNVGGWRNTGAAVEADHFQLGRKPCTIETGRWYDLRLEVRGSRIRGYLDGKLLTDVDLNVSGAPCVLASAALDEASNEVILKLVNTAAEPSEIDVQLGGLQGLSTAARAFVLTSEKPTDENTLERPDLVKPQEETFQVEGARVRRRLPQNSLTVLRIPR